MCIHNTSASGTYKALSGSCFNCFVRIPITIHPNPQSLNIPVVFMVFRLWGLGGDHGSQISWAVYLWASWFQSLNLPFNVDDMRLLGMFLRGGEEIKMKLWQAQGLVHPEMLQEHLKWNIANPQASSQTFSPPSIAYF